LDSTSEFHMIIYVFATRASNQTMKLTATAVRFGETFLVINSLPLRFTLCVSGGSLSFSR